MITDILLQNAKNVADNTNIKFIDKETDIQQVLEFIKQNTVFNIDTERNSLDPHTGSILLLQIGNKYTQFVIDCRYISIRIFKFFLEDSSKLKILHNAKFDYKVFLSEGINLNNFYDTMIAELIIYSSIDNLGYSLKDLIKRYIGIELNKEIRKNFLSKNYSKFTEEEIEYAAKDVAYLEYIRDRQLQNLEELELLNILNLELQVCKVLAKMEYNGIQINKNKWINISNTTNLKIQEIEKEVENITIQYATKNNQFKKFLTEDNKLLLNLSSPKQKLELLRLIDYRINSTNEKTLDKYKSLDLVKLFIKYNKIKKLNSSYGKSFLNFINKQTNRIHPDYWQVLTTGRMSCSNPNIQQIPARDIFWGPLFRECFEARKGYILVGGDYAQFELRIAAQLSQEPFWIDIFNNPTKDLHSELCAKTFNIDIKDVKKPSNFKPDISYRDIQKTINYGISYGMSGHKLSETLEIPLDIADKIISDFFETIPRVKRFLDSCGKYALQKGYIRTAKPYSRKRFFPSWPPDNRKTAGEIERAAKNLPMQGTNADILKKALILLDNEIEKNNYPVYILMAVHDEIVCEVKEDFAEKWAAIQKQKMIEAGQEILTSIPVICDTKIGYNWQQIH